MKKREITNSDLEQLFNNVIEQTPLINEEQVNSLLSSLPKAKTGSTVRQFFQNRLNALIVGTIVLSIVVGVILWENAGNKTERTIAQKNKRENGISPTPAETVADTSIANMGKNMIQNAIREDDTLKISSKKSSSETNQTDTIISVLDVYKHFDKQPQIFSFQASKDTTIICKEGTSIRIKANSFISEKTGKEISGKVQIEVKEYYNISDIILSNLSTTSGNKILETGGMLHITATAENENCMIKKGRNLEIGFPYSGKKDDMTLFNGEWANDKMEWKQADTIKYVKEKIEVVQRSEPENAFVVVEEMPEFPGGELGFRRYIIQNARYTYSAIKNRIEGKVIVTFVVDKFGQTNNIQIVSGLETTLDKVAVYLVSKMPAWKPARQRGIAVSCKYTIPIKFTFKNSEFTDEEIRQSKILEEKIKDLKYDPGTRSYITNNEALDEKLEKRIKEDNLQEASIIDVDRYVFSVSQLGWINCDRFDNDKNPKTDFSILIDEQDKTIVNLIFHRIKAIVPGRIESNRIIFKNVPLGEKITIVALKIVNCKLFLAVKETEITDNEETILDFQPVTMKWLKKEIEKLNKFN